MLTVLVSAPPIAAALIAGLVIASLQALTQIQEQTIQVAAKIIVVFGTLYILGHWMAVNVMRFGRLIFENFSAWVY